MERELRDKVVEAVLHELGGRSPDLIRVFGESSKECDDFMKELSYRVDCGVTNRSCDESAYDVNLDYFIGLYKKER